MLNKLNDFMKLTAVDLQLDSYDVIGIICISTMTASMILVLT